MLVSTTAPGKVVLLGEYSVLQGGAALAMAVDRQVRVRIKGKSTGDCTVCAPTLSPYAVRFNVAENGHVRWLQDENENGHRFFNLLQSVVGSLSEEGAVRFQTQQRFDIELDSTALHLLGPRGRWVKLGLGSSAALTVALAEAFVEYTGQARWSLDRWMPALIKAHRRFQGDQGSGVDVAASLHGGLIEYRWINKRPCADHLRLPSGLKFVFVWSGQSASTHQLLQRLRSWRENHSVNYTRCMDELGSISSGAIEAIRQGNTAAFLTATDRFSTAVAELGVQSGLEIFNPAHQDLLDMAKKARLVYKPCGAGGGDLGVAMGVESENTKKFAELVKNSDYQIIDISLIPEGVQTIRSQ
ncbi:MAG: hypothetical protein QNI91_04580 [Arenicellales bacterium]|nr:hypothetical protein [Arenicellales bacterium]